MFNSVDEGREQEYLPKAEAAVYAAVSERTLERLVKQGRLESQTALVPGKRPVRMISKLAIDAYRPPPSSESIYVSDIRHPITLIEAAITAMEASSRLHMEALRTLLKLIRVEPTINHKRRERNGIP
jgi:hypothetical protein